MFKAPVRVGDRLSDPELLAPAPNTTQAGPRKSFDAMLLLPAFGLLLCGVLGVVVNGYLLVKLIDPVRGRAWAAQSVESFRAAGFFADDPPEAKAALDRDREDSLLRTMRWVFPLGALVSAGVLLGGLSIALRWNYRLAMVGCVLATINLPHLCCVPGAVAGLWGLLMLNSDEGRAHFQRPTQPTQT